MKEYNNYSAHLNKRLSTRKRALALEQELLENSSRIALYETVFDWYQQTYEYKLSTLQKIIKKKEKTLFDKLHSMLSVSILSNIADHTGRILNTFPVDLSPFENATTIYLDSVTETSIPNGLSKLAKLEQLAIYAPLKIINPELAKINRECRLSLGGLLTANIPISVVKNKCFSWLSLSSNMDKVPATLKYSQAAYLRLEYPNAPFPNFLPELPNLANIDIHFASVPNQLKDMGSFKNLFRLRLTTGSLKTLPVWIDKITELDYLNLDMENLESLPDWLFKKRILGVHIENHSFTHFQYDTYLEKAAENNWFKHYRTFAIEEWPLREEDNDLQQKATVAKVSHLPRIESLQQLSQQRQLLAREVFELEILQKLENSTNAEELLILQQKLQNEPTDDTLRAQLLEFIQADITAKTN